jgi:hypothetical protein
LKEFFLPYLHKYVKEWSDIKQCDIEILKTIGLTNKTYILRTIKEIEPKAIIFRHFGKTGEGVFLDRSIE